jgi:hypothetical protein
MFSHRIGLVARHIAAEGSASFTALEIEIGAVGSLADDAKFAGLHALNLSDLIEQ